MNFLQLYDKLGKQSIRTNKVECKILINGEFKEIVLKFDKGVPYLN